MIILPIKKKWFDMILSGEKKEEYRDIKPFYARRIGEYLRDRYSRVLRDFSRDHIVDVLFRNGYSKDSPEFWAECEVTIGTGKPEWGAEEGKLYYVLTIVKITNLPPIRYRTFEQPTVFDGKWEVTEASK